MTGSSASPSGEEFEEIAHAGGKVEFLRSEEGVSLRYSHSNPTPFAMFVIAIAPDGTPLHFVPVRGMGVGMPHIAGSLLVFVGSDREGFWGRSCPNCKKYFRTDLARRDMYCPYCEHYAENVAFTTKNQMEYARVFVETFQKAWDDGADVVMNLDAIADQLPENRPVWLYAEERQQKRVKCASCGIRFDILGEYGACPGCLRRNNVEAFNTAMDLLQERFDKADRELSGQAQRAQEWEGMLMAALATFDGMANDIRAGLLRLPHVPSRRNELSQLSFQSIPDAAERLKQWFGINLLQEMKDIDKTFLLRIVHRRHLITHKSGVIDEEYVSKTGDTTVRMGQRVRVDSGEIPRLIALLRSVGKRLVEGYESMGYPAESN